MGFQNENEKVFHGFEDLLIWLWKGFKNIFEVVFMNPTMSAKSPWDTHAVVGIFYPHPFFAAKITIVSPLPPLYNIELIAEALSYLERHHFPLQCYLYHLHATLFYRGGDFVVCLRHKSQEVFQDFWQTLLVYSRSIDFLVYYWN